MEFKIPEIKDPFKALQTIMFFVVVPIIIYCCIYNGSEKQARENYNRELASSVSGKITRKESDGSNRGYKLHLNSGTSYKVDSNVYSEVEEGDSIYKLSGQDSLFVKKINGTKIAFDVVGRFKDYLRK